MPLDLTRRSPASSSEPPGCRTSTSSCAASSGPSNSWKQGRTCPSRKSPRTPGSRTRACSVITSSALANLAVLEEEKLVENAARRGAELLTRFGKLHEKYPLIGDVRGRGVEASAQDRHPLVENCNSRRQRQQDKDCRPDALSESFCRLAAQTYHGLALFPHDVFVKKRTCCT